MPSADGWRASGARMCDELVDARPARLRRVDRRHHARIEHVGVDVDPEAVQLGPHEPLERGPRPRQPGRCPRSDPGRSSDAGGRERRVAVPGPDHDRAARSARRRLHAPAASSRRAGERVSSATCAEREAHAGGRSRAGFLRRREVGVGVDVRKADAGRARRLSPSSAPSTMLQSPPSTTGKRPPSRPAMTCSASRPL